MRSQCMLGVIRKVKGVPLRDPERADGAALLARLASEGPTGRRTCAVERWDGRHGGGQQVLIVQLGNLN